MHLKRRCVYINIHVTTIWEACYSAGMTTAVGTIGIAETPTGLNPSPAVVVLEQTTMQDNAAEPQNASGSERLLERIVDKQPTDKARREERARCDVMQMPLTAREFYDA